MAAEPDNRTHLASRAVVHAALGQWEKAIADYDRVLEGPITAENRTYLQARANAHAELGQWKQAEADFARYVVLMAELRDTTEGRFSVAMYAPLAVIRLHLGDERGYQDACAELMKYRAPTTGREALPPATTSWPCLLAPGAVMDKDYEKIMDGATGRGAGPGGGGFAPATMARLLFSVPAAVLYRQGKLDEAEKQLLSFTGERPNVKAGDYFFLAMAQQKLGRKEEAGKSLAAGIRLMSEPLAEDPFGVSAWRRRLAEKILRQEAERVLKGERP